jgi:hypothetical protein
VVDISRYTEDLIVDKVYFEAADACIGTCACDLGFEVFFELEGPGCFPRGGVAADEDELWASVTKIWGKSNVEGLTGILYHTSSRLQADITRTSTSILRL